MKKLVSVDYAASLIKDGSSLMTGGFLKCGSPKEVIEKLLENGTKDLTLIANDTSFPEFERGKLVVNKRIKKAIVSHIGTNPETGKQMHSGEMEVELVPQGTLAERIRAAGAGLGGILTPTGIGTIVQEGKTVLEVDGNKYLLEKPLKADVALIYGTKVDSFGNISFFGSTRNFNTVMATAADIVIVEADEIVEGSLDPNEIVIPGIFVDYIVKGGN
ncbi:CoA transferase subunit A [Cetobacterium sp. 8H]|uniref:CoA transferase subunit A n=1 Tax=Cetobacterium sp. 8H TaxID=2759681 RepID=UPI00163CE7C6|nr:CoA transferase subunit A [Cetobacterium sp. 8H]MBC2851822.1 CoA transferase subunit A [Cetobacterium sp. 8H]